VGAALQIPLRTMSTIEGYIATQEWRRARLPGCPLHSNGSCSFRRHGSYARVTSPGVRIARYYCPQGHMTFSLLPDFLAAQLPGSLMAVDRVVATAISAGSMEAAADTVRGLEVCLPGAVRWLRRRVTAVRRSVAAVRTIAPSLSRQDLAEGKMPPLTQLRRALAPQILHGIPPPLGFQRVWGKPAGARSVRCSALSAILREDFGTVALSGFRQHEVGPDRASIDIYTEPIEVKRCPYPSIIATQLPLSRPP
jgi:hypothetical protein